MRIIFTLIRNIFYFNCLTAMLTAALSFVIEAYWWSYDVNKHRLLYVSSAGTMSVHCSSMAKRCHVAVAVFLWEPPSTCSRTHSPAVLWEHPAERRLAQTWRRRHPRVSAEAQDPACQPIRLTQRETDRHIETDRHVSENETGSLDTQMQTCGRPSAFWVNAHIFLILQKHWRNRTYYENE